MDDSELRIDLSKHERVPSLKERFTNALLSLLFSFALIQLIGFWMFPGIGIGGLYMFSSVHSLAAFVGDLANIFIISFMATCTLLGWFQGKYFTDRLKGYLKWWKFW